MQKGPLPEARKDRIVTRPKPVFKGVIPPSMPVHATFVVLAIALRFTSGSAGKTVIGIANWAVLAFFVWRFAMELGGISGQL